MERRLSKWFSRSRAGTLLDLSFEKVGIGKLAAKVIRELQSIGRMCPFVIDFPLDLPPVTADPVRLELVLRNPQIYSCLHVTAAESI